MIRPTNLEFKHRLEEWVPEYRAELVAAVLTIIRFWIDQGRPKWCGKPLASFESWSRVIGGVLDAIGVGGFLGNLHIAKEASAIAEEPWGEFCALVFERWGDRPRPVGFPGRANGRPVGDWDDDNSLVRLIEEHVGGIPLSGGDDGRAKMISLGMKMQKNARVHTGPDGRKYRLSGSGRAAHNQQLWRVECLEDNPYRSAAKAILGNQTMDDMPDPESEAGFAEAGQIKPLMKWRDPAEELRAGRVEGDLKFFGVPFKGAAKEFLMGSGGRGRLRAGRVLAFLRWSGQPA